MRIGILGPADMVQKVAKVASEFAGVVAVPLVYGDLGEICGLAASRQKELHGLFFCGPVPYLITTQEVQREIPWVYLSYESTGLLLALFHAASDMPQLFSKGYRFSLDTIASVEARELLKETGLILHAIYTHELAPGVDTKRDFSQFHRNLYQKGKTDFSITCVRVVAENLRKDGIPCFSVSPAAQTIRGTMQRLLLEIRNSQKDYMRTVVGLIRPEMRPGGGRLQNNRILSLHRALLAYGEKRQILVVPQGDKEFLLVENYGQFLLETDDLARNPLRKALLEATGLDVRIGYGVGPSLGIATGYAEKALDLAFSDRSDACYICDGFEARSLAEGNAGSPISLVAEEGSLQRYSEMLGMTSAAISRYFRAMETVGDSFSASDVARQLGISAKGARKILSAFLKAKTINECGRRTYPGKGRPERLYEFSGEGGEPFVRSFDQESEGP
jgi:hypothetical protein